MKNQNKDNRIGINKDESKNEIRLGGNIWLVGFNDIDKSELTVVKKIVGGYIRRITERMSYNEMRIRMKKHNKGKSFLHEINSDVHFGGMHLSAKSEGKNMYSAISDSLNSLIKEIEHKFKK